MRTELSSLSVEYLFLPVTTPADPSGFVVQAAVKPGLDEPVEADWKPATWMQISGKWYVRVLVGPGSAIGALTKAPHGVWYNIQANPERPYKRCPGFIYVY